MPDADDAEEAEDDDDAVDADCDVEEADEAIDVVDDDDEMDVAMLEELVGETVTVEFDTTVEVTVLVVGGRVAK